VSDVASDKGGLRRREQFCAGEHRVGGEQCLVGRAVGSARNGVKVCLLASLSADGLQIGRGVTKQKRAALLDQQAADGREEGVPT